MDMGWLLVGASGIEPDGKNRKEIEKYYEKKHGKTLP